MKAALFSLLLIFVTLACDCGEGPGLGDNSLVFRFVSSKTNQNLFTVFPLDSAYIADSVRLINPPNALTRFQKVELDASNYGFSIRYFYDPSSEGTGVPVQKTFYIFINKTDTDTLSLHFTPQKGKCEDRFEDLTFEYNGQPVPNTNTPSAMGLGIILTKKTD